jgi:hypothetical protein
MYLHWSKKVAIGLLAGFGVGVALFLLPGTIDGSQTTPPYMTIWIVLNYVGLLVWLFIWIADQARMRGKNIWVWLLPTVLAPLPTLMGFLIYLQKRMS